MQRRFFTASSTRAFSLLEIAIVIVIIGLVVGGVMAGSKMLRQAELQSITVDYGKFINSVSQFRQQYGGWPGDILDATTFWNSGGGTGAVTDATCRTGMAAPNNLTATCNGNNDGQIDDTASAHEPYLAWQHLMLAKYVKGNFTGLANASGGATLSNEATDGNVPSSRVKRAGWSFWYKSNGGVTAETYGEFLGNHLIFGAPSTTYPKATNDPILTPEEAARIDAKLDDGIPSTGRIVTFRPSGALASCVNIMGDANDANDIYDLTYTKAACELNMSLTSK